MYVCVTHQHFGEASLELDGVRHRLSRRAAYATAARVRSAQAAHAEAGLTRVMRHAGLDTADEYLAHTAIALAAAATLHDAHRSPLFSLSPLHSRSLFLPRELACVFLLLSFRLSSLRRRETRRAHSCAPRLRETRAERKDKSRTARTRRGRRRRVDARTHIYVHKHTHSRRLPRGNVNNERDDASSALPRDSRCRPRGPLRRMRRTGGHATRTGPGRVAQQVSPGGRPSRRTRRLPRTLSTKACATLAAATVP